MHSLYKVLVVSSKSITIVNLQWWHASNRAPLFHILSWKVSNHLFQSGFAQTFLSEGQIRPEMFEIFMILQTGLKILSTNYDKNITIPGFKKNKLHPNQCNV